MSEIVHRPVMLDETLRYLVPPREDSFMLDCTLGEGGHAHAFLTNYPRLRYVGIDADPEIQTKARARLAPFAPRVVFFEGYFDEVVEELGQPGTATALGAGAGPGSAFAPDLALFDLGVSMHHFVASGRGFSHGRDETLDMRLSPDVAESAADLVNGAPESELARILFEYGEERYSRRIARAIVDQRSSSRIRSSGQLAEIVASAVPPACRHGRIHPATRTFQALRIAVNDELGRARRAVESVLRLLPPGGTLAVISFHSLEDRIAKTLFRAFAGSGPGTDGFPGIREAAGSASQEERRSTPGADAAATTGPTSFEVLTKKPLEPAPEEIATNPASRSARMRVIRRRRIGEVPPESARTARMRVRTSGGGEA